jgi:hypothetical protein
MINKTFKVIVAGSREFSDYELLRNNLDTLLRNRIKDGYSITIVSGGARGADLLGEQYAKERGYWIEVWKADWDKHGKSAGYIRNIEMAIHAEALVAFSMLPVGSLGTNHMIKIATERQLDVRIINFVK